VNNPQLKIMIVEDEYIFALDTKNTLQQMGYEVTGISSNYYGAVESAAHNKPDLVLMDINIKGDVNGIDTSKYLLRVHNIPSLFLTAYNDEATIQKLSQVHSIGVMFKPLDDVKFTEIMYRFEKTILR
jgi:two-component system, response regulator PdtaR